MIVFLTIIVFEKGALISDYVHVDARLTDCQFYGWFDGFLPLSYPLNGIYM